MKPRQSGCRVPDIKEVSVSTRRRGIDESTDDLRLKKVKCHKRIGLNARGVWRRKNTCYLEGIGKRFLKSEGRSVSCKIKSILRVAVRS